jgi:hypothetical protein
MRILDAYLHPIRRLLLPVVPPGGDRLPKACVAAGGFSSMEGKPMAKCETCGGTGRVFSSTWDGLPVVCCSECDGTGNYKGDERQLRNEITRLRERVAELECLDSRKQSDD